jgi:hypothetical protein
VAGAVVGGILLVAGSERACAVAVTAVAGALLTTWVLLVEILR